MLKLGARLSRSVENGGLRTRYTVRSGREELFVSFFLGMSYNAVLVAHLQLVVEPGRLKLGLHIL